MAVITWRLTGSHQSWKDVHHQGAKHGAFVRQDHLQWTRRRRGGSVAVTTRRHLGGQGHLHFVHMSCVTAMCNGQGHLHFVHSDADGGGGQDDGDGEREEVAEGDVVRGGPSGEEEADGTVAKGVVRLGGGEIWGRYGEMWGDVGRCGEIVPSRREWCAWGAVTRWVRGG